jgi:hypothetical protein
MLNYVGNSLQIRGAERYILQDGKGDGMHFIYVRNGKGLEAWISVDRGGDIARVTIDGKNMETTGSTVIFEGKGLKKLADFSISETNSTSNSVMDITSISRNVNDFKNNFGVSKVVVIQSQMGVPICAYGGNNVYWEIPEDLPKTTKLMIDGKPLYIHRANYVMLDTALLK